MVKMLSQDVPPPVIVVYAQGDSIIADKTRIMTVYTRLRFGT
jgi:hypothetical protein